MRAHFTGSDIITLLKAEKPYLNEKFGVVSIGLFGSFARDMPQDDSDIDLMVELKEPRFDWIAGLQIYLEKKLNRKIEIVRKSSRFNSRFTQQVEKEVIYA